MSVPDFRGIELGAPASGGGADEWRAAVKKAAGGDDLLWETPEGIAVKPLYTGRDLEGLDFFWALIRVSRRICAARIRRCTSTSPGPSASTRVFFHCRGVQRLLPAESGGRPEGPVRRFRPAHAPRLRQRPPAGDR
ncbi:hypothetical protein GCM10020295_18020 [Streptomyces cinereospinus]